MLDRYKDLYMSKNKVFNTALSRKDYESVGSILNKSGLIQQIPPFEDFYRPVFSEQNLKPE